MNDPGTCPPKKRPPKRVIFFGACAVTAILVYAIANASDLVAFFARIGDVLAPLIIGCVIAYLFNPFLKFYEYILFRKLHKGNWRRGLSLLCTVLTFFGILAVVIALILPELIESITQLINNYEFYLNGLLSFVQSVIDTLPENVHAATDFAAY